MQGLAFVYGNVLKCDKRRSSCFFSQEKSNHLAFMSCQSSARYGIFRGPEVRRYRRVHAFECIMGNQGKMERNSKVCKEVQNAEKYS